MLQQSLGKPPKVVLPVRLSSNTRRYGVVDQTVNLYASDGWSELAADAALIKKAQIRQGVQDVIESTGFGQTRDVVSKPCCRRENVRLKNVERNGR